MLSRILYGIGTPDTMCRLPFFYWAFCEILQLTYNVLDHLLVAEELIKAPKMWVLRVKGSGVAGNHNTLVVSSAEVACESRRQVTF